MAGHALVVSAASVFDAAKVGKGFQSSLQNILGFLLLTYRYVSLQGQEDYLEKYSYLYLKVDLFGQLVSYWRTKIASG